MGFFVKFCYKQRNKIGLIRKTSMQFGKFLQLPTVTWNALLTLFCNGIPCCFRDLGVSLLLLQFGPFLHKWKLIFLKKITSKNLPIAHFNFFCFESAFQLLKFETNGHLLPLTTCMSKKNKNFGGISRLFYMLLGYCTPQPSILFYSPQNEENRLYIHDTSIKTSPKA